MSKILFSLLVLFLNTSCKNSSELNTHDNETVLTEDMLDPTEGTDVGNGGDLIQCYPSAPKFLSDFTNGWYTLDYAELDKTLSLYSKGNLPLKIYLSHVRQVLSQAAPELLQSYDNYLKTVPFSPYFSNTQQEDSNIYRTWVAQNKNEEINDENPSYIPSNCRLEDGKSIKLHQVVVRKEVYITEKQQIQVTYHYDTSLVGRLDSKNLQISMLIVHEWLWDYFDADQSKRLRIANRLLHSQSKVPPQFIRKALLLEEDLSKPKYWN